MPRTTNPAMDALIDAPPIQVHERGFIRVVDFMGDDAAIVQAARVSYGAGTKTARDDEGLIRYLMRHRHTSPFEMCELKIHVKAPIFVARQWLRQRTASVNEMSGRYSEMSAEVFVPAVETVSAQASHNRQGRGARLLQSIAECAALRMESDATIAFAGYNSLLAGGIAREQARIVLPLATYTEWYWKIDLHNLLNFLEQRLHPHAQQEIRDYATELARIVEAWCPMAWRAFSDYRLNAVTLSAQQVEALRQLVNSGELADGTLIARLPKRERQDLRVMLGWDNP